MKAGETYIEFWNERNINNKTIHILSIVEDHVMFKWKNGWWIYDVTNIDYFNLLVEKQILKLEKT